MCPWLLLRSPVNLASSLWHTCHGCRRPLKVVRPCRQKEPTHRGADNWIWDVAMLCHAVPRHSPRTTSACLLTQPSSSPVTIRCAQSGVLQLISQRWCACICIPCTVYYHHSSLGPRFSCLSAPLAARDTCCDFRAARLLAATAQACAVHCSCLCVSDSAATMLVACGSCSHVTSQACY